MRYCLTGEGEHLFPKKYPELLIGLFDTIAAEGGADAATPVLARITDDRVAELEPRVRGASMKRRMSALRAIYGAGDPFADVERRGEDYVVIERNCPYLNFAMERPEICSTTVSTLRRSRREALTKPAVAGRPETLRSPGSRRSGRRGGGRRGRR